MHNGALMARTNRVTGGMAQSWEAHSVHVCGHGKGHVGVVIHLLNFRKSSKKSCPNLQRAHLFSLVCVGQQKVGEIERQREGGRERSRGHAIHKRFLKVAGMPI